MLSRKEQIDSEIVSLILSSGVGGLQSFIDNSDVGIIFRQYIQDKFEVDDVSELTLEQRRQLIDWIDKFRVLASADSGNGE